MRSDKKIKPKYSGLVKILYLLSAVLAVVFAYMLTVNILYISSYTSSYNMEVSYIWQEVVQYVVTGSISYLVYAVLLLSAGKMLSCLGKCAVYNVKKAENVVPTVKEVEHEKVQIIEKELVEVPCEENVRATPRRQQKKRRDRY